MRVPLDFEARHDASDMSLKYIYIYFHVVFSFLKQGLRQAGTREDLLDQTLYFKQSRSFSGAIHALSR